MSRILRLIRHLTPAAFLRHKRHTFVLELWHDDRRHRERGLSLSKSVQLESQNAYGWLHLQGRLLSYRHQRQDLQLVLLQHWNVRLLRYSRQRVWETLRIRVWGMPRGLWSISVLLRLPKYCQPITIFLLQLFPGYYDIQRLRALYRNESAGLP